MTPRKLRALTGLSQVKFAERIGVSRMTVYRREKVNKMDSRYANLYALWKRDKSWFGIDGATGE